MGGRARLDAKNSRLVIFGHDGVNKVPSRLNQRRDFETELSLTSCCLALCCNSLLTFAQTYVCVHLRVQRLLL